MTLEFQPSESAQRVSAGSLRRVAAPMQPGHINFGIGEPGFQTPEPIVEAFTHSDLFERPGYGDFHGKPELRELIADLTSTTTLRRQANDVIVTNGATSGITAVILATVGPGDRVIIPAPTYSLYADAVNLAGATPVFVPLTPDFQLDIPAIAREAEGAKLVIVCNPGNPTGVILTRNSLIELGETLRGTQTLVLSDEAYAAYNYDGSFVSALEIESLSDRLIYSQTLSKTYSMTGWRAGYIVGPSKVMPWVQQVHRGMFASLNRAVQDAAIVALRNGPESVRRHLEDFAARRQIMIDALVDVPGVDFVRPNGAFYVFLRYHYDMSSLEMAAHLRQHGVVVRPGREFGAAGERHVRLAYVVEPAEIEAGITRIRAALAELSA